MVYELDNRLMIKEKEIEKMNLPSENKGMA
jgi:hypothetical protein